MRQWSTELDQSVLLVMETCPEAEFKAYLKVVGKIMGSIYLDVLVPIHRRFPDLEPEEWKSLRK